MTDASDEPAEEDGDQALARRRDIVLAAGPYWERWCTASEGLRTVRALQAYLHEARPEHGATRLPRAEERATEA